MRRWLFALLVGCTCASLLTALFWGWFSVWFQLAGSVAARDDYLVSTGAYGSGVVVVSLGLVASYRWGARGWPVIVLGLGLALLLVLTISSAVTAAGTASDGIGVDSWPTGVRVVMMWPWTWLPLLAGPLALVGVGPGPTPAPSEGPA
jgi:hypothetical protein